MADELSVHRCLSGDPVAKTQIFQDLSYFLQPGSLEIFVGQFFTHTALCLELFNAVASREEAEYKVRLVSAGVVDLLVCFIPTCTSKTNRPAAVACLASISESVWTRKSIPTAVKEKFKGTKSTWISTVNLTPFHAQEFDDWSEMLLNTELVTDYKPEPPGKHIYDPSEFPALAILEQNFEVIKAEALGLSHHQDKLIPWPEKFIAAEGQWDILGLYAFENRLDKLCTLCPQTTKLLETIPGLQTALFSCLRPRAHIKPHIGYYQYSEKILRVHLGLIVPDGCVLKVNGVEHRWEEGKLMVFDDTYRHEAWNPSYDTTRVVLMFDILVDQQHVKPEFRNPDFCEKAKKQKELGSQALISADLLGAISNLVDNPENVLRRPEKYL